MKILHLLPSLESGGMETFVLSLARQQRSDGLDVGIALFCGREETPKRYERDGIQIWEFNRGQGTWAVAKAVRGLLRDQSFTLLHAHNETSTIFGAIACLGLRGVAYVSTVHNGDRARYSLKQRIENYLAFRRCGAIVSVTEQIAGIMAAREFISPRRVRIIKNGIISVAAAGEADRVRLRQSLSIGNADVVVGCVGRLVPVKNHLLFLSAFKQALDSLSGTNMVLVLVGDGPLRRELEKAVHSLGLQASTRLLGDRGDVPALLNVMDIFALPSLNEGHSISLLEAFSAGKAVIASNRGGNPTLVAQGVTGLLVDPESVASMSEAIIALANDPGMRASLGGQGRKLQREKYGMETCSRNYLELYRSLR